MTSFPLVVGCRRSGINLIRAMCASHPEIAVPPEAPFVVDLLPMSTPWSTTPTFDPTRFLRDALQREDLRRWKLPRPVVQQSFREDPPTSYPDAVRRLYTLWARQEGKERYLDATPDNLDHLEALTTLFPEARIVHVVRDGRDVAASLLELGIVSTIEDGALHWYDKVQRARESLRRLPAGRQHELHYEDLVRSPEATLRSMCTAVELPYEPSMLNHRGTATRMLRRSTQPYRNRYLAHPLMPALRDWRRDLPARAVDAFDALAGDLLTELDYELRLDRRPLRTRIAANAHRRGWRRRVAA